jgi:hypothetical protein
MQQLRQVSRVLETYRWYDAEPTFDPMIYLSTPIKHPNPTVTIDIGKALPIA